MRIRYATCLLLSLIVLAGRAGAQHASDAERFAGFPEIGKYRPGARSMKVITSDAVEGVLRPEWTRAMTDLGGWPAMYRFRGTIFLVFPHYDGHRYKRHEATGKYWCYTSGDEGRSWGKQPDPDFRYTPEFVVARESVFAYDWAAPAAADERQPVVRTSSDGIAWSEPRPIYKPPFYFWGAMYDPVGKMFWAPPHAIPSAASHPERRIDLVRSPNGIDWEHVSTVVTYNNASESVLRFEEDRTMVMLIRRKYGRNLTVAVARPPYTEWELSERPVITEGEHFFEIGGQTFLATRALYTGDNADVLANPKLFDGRRAYSMIYRWTADRQLVPHAVMHSMGDCSYPFLVETPTEILCAYYSQHEDQVCKVFLCAYDKERFLKTKDE